MKVIIQIPCLNEEQTLPMVFEKMPKYISGVSKIEYQIIDDGSTDDTVAVAKKLGVTHILRSSLPGKNRRWLGRAFSVGLENALAQEADILVNTDGDNQYPSERIPDLIKPILKGEADIAIGDRQTRNISEFSFIKKILQRLGSLVTQLLSGQKVPDAVSGFRAYSRHALEKINILTDYTYTVDTLMQAEKKGLDVSWVKIKTNPKTRESRLIKNLWSKVKKSGSTILRMYAIYEPFKTFLLISSVFFLIGFGLVARFGYYYAIGDSNRFIQSVTIGVAFIIIGVQLVALGILADLMAVNRKLMEQIVERQKVSTYRKKDS